MGEASFFRHAADNASLRRGYRAQRPYSVMLIGPSGGRVSHHDLMDALGNDSMLAAMKTSLTPCAITWRAASRSACHCAL
jgi:hypothetical protein